MAVMLKSIHPAVIKASKRYNFICISFPVSVTPDDSRCQKQEMPCLINVFHQTFSVLIRSFRPPAFSVQLLFLQLLSS